MEKDRRVRRTTILILFMAVIGLTLGFAAFSSTLIIESKQYVKPNASDFKLVLYGYDYDKHSNPKTFRELSKYVSDPYQTVGNVSASRARIDNDELEITNLNATFSEPGQSVAYKFLVNNEGKYAAYLNKIKFTNIFGSKLKKKCTNVDATQELVTAACDDIKLYVQVGKNKYFDTANLTYRDIRIPKDQFLEFYVYIEYDYNGDRADGQFEIDFGDILLEFGTANG